MNRKKRFTSFAILSVLTLACQQAGQLIATPTPTLLSPTATVPSPTATITFTPTATAFLALQTDPVTFKAGGFIMEPLKGYEKELNSYQAFLQSPDEKVTIFLFTEAKPSGKTPIGLANSYMEYFKGSIHDFSEGESQDIVIDSAEGVSKDYAGTLDEEPLRGKIAIVFPEDSKILTVIVQTIGEGRWESEGELAYSAMLKKITFFKLQVANSCPIARNQDYGYTLELPIKIGGGASNGPDREEEFLSGLLGPRGEIVSFYRSESIEKDGVILDKFIVSYNNTYKTIYMDIYDYDKPQFPFGFNCSTTGPLVP